tara:strand:- start:224 stop:793 length:570 start_codon:yes stop_codon:yes gene_type:complete
MGYLGNQITTVFPTSISVDSATISGNATVGGTLGVTGVSTLTENIVFDASSKGVHLGVTSATASNLLDDYEEGTWTPATSSPSYNTASSTGLYTKIGRIVIAHFSINFSGVNSSANSNCVITNFPFTNGGAIASAGTVRESSNTGAVYVTRIGTNTTIASMNSMDNVTSGSQRTIRTGEDYVGSLIYVT